MANRRKKDKILSFFKSKFDVTMFHKPSGDSNDIFYVIIINDTLQLRIKNVGNVIIIDEVKPLSNEHEQVSNEIIAFFINQTSYNVLISNIPAINEICDKLSIPVVDDERFITVPIPLYKRYINYYNNNSNMYGFYLLAVLDDITIESTDNDINESEVIDSEDDIDSSNDNDDINNIKTPSELSKDVMDVLMDISKSGKCYINASSEYNIKLSLSSGIDMELSMGSDVIDISNIKFSPNSPSTALLSFVQMLLTHFNKNASISITTSFDNKNVVDLCDILEFKLNTNKRGSLCYYKNRSDC